MTEPIKQHYVPEVYLKRFCLNQAGDLFTLKVKVQYSTKAKKVNKSQICYEPDRYTLDNTEIMEKLKISDPYIIEKKCFPYENKELETLFDKIDNQEKFTHTEFKKLIRILLDIKRRNPWFSKNFNSIDPNSIIDFPKVKEIYKEAITSFYEKNGINNINIDKITNDSFEKVQKKSNDPNFKSNTYKSGFYEENDVTEEVISELLNWEAMVVYTDHNNPFITSDNPGYTINSNDRIRNTNFASALIYTFPISPKSTLLLRRSQTKSLEIYKQIDYSKASPDKVIHMNNATLLNSNETIISNSKEQLEITSKFNSKDKE